MEKAKKKPDAGAPRVLILEDDPADAELVQRALRRAGMRFSARVTKNRREFSAALAGFLPQVILSDFKLPGFDGMAALALARARAPEIPFIFVSGSIGEEKAIEILSQGASDYIFKDNLARLGPVVKRVLAEAETRRQKAETEKSLRENERMFSTLVANLPGFAYRCRHDRDWTMEFISAGCRKITGYGPEDFMASRKLSFGDIIRHDFRIPIRKEWQRRLKRREPFEFEYAIRGAAGMERWVWERGQGVFTANGQLLFLEGFITDITDRRKAELLRQQALAEAERLRQALDQVPAYVYMKDPRSRYIYANQLTLELFGCSAEKLPGSPDSRFFPPVTVKKLRQIDRRVLAGESTVEEIVVPDPQKGERIYLEVKTPIHADPRGGKAWGVLGISSDITESRHQAQALRESEEKYRTLVAESPDGIFIADLQGNFISVNPSMCSELGYSEQELLAMKIWDIVPERFRSQHEQRLAGLLAGKARNEAAEYRVRTRDGRERYVAILSAPYTKDGTLAGFMGIARDISEKMEMETRLRSSEEFHRTLIETSPDAIITIDGGGRITFASQRALDLFAVPGGGDVLGASVLDFVDSSDAVRVQDRLVEILAGHSLPGISEYRLQRQDRRLFWGEVSSAPLRNDKGRNIGLLLICRDISDRKLAEERISVSLKEKEVLLQEIHHRVKNNLQIVSGLLTLQAGHAASKSVEEMFRESQDRIRSIALVHESLYKSHNLAEIAFDDYLRALVDNLVSSHSAASGRVAVQYDMERILLTIETAIPLGLIVNELVTNALKHAFPGVRRGQIRVQLHGGDKEHFVGVKTKSGTLYRVPTCELTVADDGIGLPAGFELAGQKTLGIQILSMLAGQLNGELTVRGGPGTEWRIVIPAQPMKSKTQEAKT